MKSINPFKLCSLVAALLLGPCSAFAQIEIPWDDVDKTGSSLADLETRDAGDLTGKIAITDSTSSTNSTTGAATFVGGIGTQDNINADGYIRSGDGFDSAGYLGRIQDRSDRGRIIFDGTTSNRRVVWPLGEVGDVAGWPITVLIEHPGIDADPSTEVTVVALQSHDTSVGASDNGLGLRITGGAGRAELMQWDNYTAVFRRKIDNNFRAAHMAKTGRMGFVVASADSAVDPLFYARGKSIAGDLSDSNSGGAPNWNPAAGFSPNYLVMGRHWGRGEGLRVILVLGAFSEAELAEWTNGGRVPDWAEQAAYPVITNSGTDNSDFNGGTAGNWIGSGAGGPSVANVDNRLEITVGDAFTGAVLGNGSAKLVEGRTYTAFFDIVSVSAGTVSFSKSDYSANYKTGLGVGSHSVLFVQNGSAGVAFRGTVAGSVISVDNVRLIQVGSMLRAYHQPGHATGDLLGRISGRIVGGAQFPDSGVRDITIDLPFSYTGSSIQLLGGDLLGGLDARVVSVTGYTDTNTTIDLGTTSGGAELVNDHAANGLFDVSTYVTRIISNGGSLYLTPANNPTSGTIQIVLQPFNQ